jgi:two-component system NtrC family response regulator
MTTGSVHRLTVLFANEQEAWHQTARSLLEPQGVRTLSARSGREALEILSGQEVHVAVLDYRMPQLGGLQILKLLHDRRGPSASRPVPPAILVADDLTTHLLNEALGARVFSVLSKPVDLNLLLGTLARVMKRHYAGCWPE